MIAGPHLKIEMGGTPHSRPRVLHVPMLDVGRHICLTCRVGGPRLRNIET
jgi:hypothetical protein